MKKICAFLAMVFFCIGTADAAVRNGASVVRTATSDTGARATKAATTAKGTKTVSRNISSTARTAITSRNGRTSQSVARTATQKTSDKIRTAIKNTNTRSDVRTRTGTSKPVNTARSIISLATTPSNTFGTGYNTCRDAYFTCMDQFCGTANDTYRRCICSSKLSEIQSRERALSQASHQLSDFQSLNLSVIDKTASEVGAMLSASAGENAQSQTFDTSGAASELSGIRDVLANTKKTALSTQGTLDIAGNISSIWNTTDLIGGANISDLTGEALYNAVHAQCAEMVADKCTSSAIQTMVVSAYGMYIENDCSLLVAALDGKLSAANSTIHATEREMQLARLENYNAHNSTTINNCIAKVRQDITAETACGPDYVHCLDVTGLYLSYDTGEPIYTPNFYQLEHQLSLSGDILSNQTNRILVSTLNDKRTYATNSLDTCRDIADEVWNEFMRQVITEIYQGQHERIRQVKNECLDVVTQCYDTQTQSLKDFSNIDEKLLLGSRMELSEQMCQEKLNTCSNLYGGGTQGMEELLNAMHNITNQTIGQQCVDILRNYAKQMCAVPAGDTLHKYPYGCRTYTPGEQIYATLACNMRTENINKQNIYAEDEFTINYNEYIDITNLPYKCTAKKYVACKDGYYLDNGDCIARTSVQSCPDGYYLHDGACIAENSVQCGDYVGSLYHKLARYAIQTCIRPSEANQELPATVLQDINVIMDEIFTNMASELASECERLDGTWVNIAWEDNLGCTGTGTSFTCTPTATDNIHDKTGQRLHTEFYLQTTANTNWGFCAEKTTTNTN